MLIAGLVGILIAAPSMSGAAMAEPGAPPIVVAGDNNGGWVDTHLAAPAGTPAMQQVGASVTRTTNSASGVSCAWTVEAQYFPGAAYWTGGTAGTWYDVRCSDGTAVPIGVFVPAGSASPALPVVQSSDLARTAANRLPLPSPRIGRSPAGTALVGLPTWLWVDPGQWQVLQQRTSVGPVWAQVTASPVSTRWDPGDGSPALLCAGPGTPYDRSRPESAQSTDCSVTYRRSSAGQSQTGPGVNDRFFPMTVTVTWQVSWTGSDGTGGALPAMTRTASVPVPVAQRQTVVTGGSG